MLTTTQPPAAAPNHHQRLETARTTRFNHAPRPDSWRPPNHAADPDPKAPLAHIDPDRLVELMNAVLEDWDTPGFTELGLCRAHQITLDQLLALAKLPKFQHALETLRAIRALRRADLESAANLTALDALHDLAGAHPTTTSGMKERRLAVKSLLTLLGAAGFQPVDRAKPDAPDPSGAGGFQPPDRAKPDAPDPSGAAGFQPPDRPQADAPAAPGADGFQPPDRPQADTPAAPGAEGFQPPDRPQADAKPPSRTGAGRGSDQSSPPTQSKSRLPGGLSHESKCLPSSTSPASDPQDRR